jgi:hypothetical protein
MKPCMHIVIEAEMQIYIHPFFIRVKNLHGEVIVHKPGIQ